MEKKHIYYYVLQEHKTKIEAQTIFKPEICYQILSNCTTTIKSKDGYASVPYTKFKSIISNYSQYINYLCTNNMLYVDNEYTYIDAKHDISSTKGYKLREVNYSKIVKIEATNSNFVTEKTRYFAKIKNDKNKTAKKDYLKVMKSNFITFMKELPIDTIMEDAQNIFDVNERMTQFIMLDKVKNNNFYFKRNSTNNRLDTNLTNLKNNVKYYNPNNYIIIDISNCQPFFLYLLLYNIIPSPYYATDIACNYNINQIVNSNHFNYNTSNINLDELEKFKDWVCSGKFYDNFINKTGKDRQELKDLMFCILYSKSSSYLNDKKIFSNEFPTIAAFIDDFKENNGYKQFSILLQKIEARIVLDVICPLLVAAGVFIVTIHDSWIVKCEDVSKTLDIINSVFDVKPNLKLEMFDDFREDKIYEFRNNIRKLKHTKRNFKFANPMIVIKSNDKQRYSNLLKYPNENRFKHNLKVSS